MRGNIAVVTGASRGIGAATAALLARRGARVVLLARNGAALETVRSAIAAAGGTAFAYAVDLANADPVAETFARIARDVGAPSILINNAGAGAFQFLDEGSARDAAAMIEVPYLAAVFATRAVLPAMRAANRGHIVNMTSAAALRAIPGATAYTAACWAMRGFSEALRADLHGSRIRVTLVASGTSSTPGYDHYPGVIERMPRITRVIPMLTPELIARAIVDSIGRNRPLVIVPRTLRAIAVLDRIAPWLVRRLVARTGHTYIRTGGISTGRGAVSG